MSPELHRIASRVVWWDTPDRVLSREDDLLCRVMALGDLADVNPIEATYGIHGAAVGGLDGHRGATRAAVAYGHR